MFKTSKDYTIYKLKLLQIIKEANTTFTYVFSKPEDLSWEEGAHTHLALNRFDEELGWFQKPNVRHFSIMSLESEGFVCITTRLPSPHSDFKDALKKANIGDVYYLFKVGTRLALRRENKPLILLSSGVGIATLRPLVKAYGSNPTGITKMYHLNVDSSQEYLFENEFAKFQEEIENFEHQYVSSRQGFYKELNKLLKKDVIDAYFYIIGSDEFLLEVREVLSAHHIQDQQLLFDKKEEFYETLSLLPLYK